jgi:uncharacterized protein (TIRG00374 family)
VLAVLFTLLLYVVRTQRWQYLLAPLGPTRFGVALRTTVIGFAASAVLPARAGEVLRPLLLARTEGLPATATFATIVVERILDLVAVLLLLAGYLLLAGEGSAARAPELFAAVRIGAIVTAAGAVGLLIAMAVLAADPARLHRLMLGVTRILPARLGQALARLAQTFAEGLAVVRDPRRLVAALGLSLVIWVVIASQAWTVSRAFDLGVPYGGSYLLTALLVVGVALPTPGGVGGFHEAFRIGATSFFGSDNDAAVGAALVLHAASFVPVMLAGLWFTLADGLDMRRLQQLSAGGRPASAGSTAGATGLSPSKGGPGR